MATNTTPIATTKANPSAPNVNPDITLASGQKISGLDPNYAEYAKQQTTPIPTSKPVTTPAPVISTPTSTVNKDGLTMEQANDPKYWSNGQYVGPSNVNNDTTPTNTTPVKDVTKDINTYLNGGYYDTADIATKLGVDQKVVDDAIANDENSTYKLNLNKNNNQIDQSFVDYKNNIDKIINGTFELTDAEKSQLASVQAQFDKMRADQLKANQNYEGAVQTGEIRSGRQEFMNQISGGIYKQAIDDGVQKITDIEVKAASTISELKQAIADKKYKQVSDLYGNLSKYLNDKSTAINDLHKATLDAAKAQQDAIKSDLENTSLMLENNAQITDTLVPGLASLLTNDVAANQKMIEEQAAQYGIDPNILFSAMQKYITSNITSSGNTFINKVTGETITTAADAKPIEIGTDAMGNKKYGVYDQTSGSIVEIKNPASSSVGMGMNLPEYDEFLANRTPQQAEIFNGLDDTTKSNVLSLINGEVLLGDLAKGMGGAAAAQRYNALAKQVDPTYSETTNKSRVNYLKKWDDPSSSPAKTRIAINTALGHLGEFQSIASNLGNKGFVPYNKAKNFAQTQLGDPAQVDFSIVATALAGELASAYKNGTAPTDQETEKWYNALSAGWSQGQMSGVTKTTSKLISSKLVAMAEEYKKSMGKYPQQIVDQYILDELKAKGVDTTSMEESLKRQAQTTPSTSAGGGSNDNDVIWKD